MKDYATVNFRAKDNYSHRETYRVSVTILTDYEDRPVGFAVQLFDSANLAWVDAGYSPFDSERHSPSLLDQIVKYTLELVNRGRLQNDVMEFAGREEEDSYALVYIRRLF